MHSRSGAIVIFSGLFFGALCTFLGTHTRLVHVDKLLKLFNISGLPTLFD